MNPENTCIVYRDELLPVSETFIPEQAESLQEFVPFYLGLRRVPGLQLPESRMHVVSESDFGAKLKRARFKLLGPSRRTVQLLSAKRPVLVHAHFAPDACNAVALSRALRTPLVASLHGYDVTVREQFLPRLYARRVGSLQAYGTRFICVSEFIRSQAILRGFSPERTVVHYTGINTDLFQPDPAVVRSPLVLFVGRLVEKKGCEYVIRAMADVQTSVPEAKLVVIGGGPLRQSLEQQAAATLKHFEFLGMQGPGTVRDWMNRAMIFCVPSVVAETGDAEGFGMVFAEAQSMGLPVVSFDSGGIREAVAREQTGFLVEERDWRQLAAKIVLLLQNQPLWSRFSEAGRARVKCLFDIRKQANRLEEIYNDVLTEWSCTPTGAEANLQSYLAATK